MIHLRPAQNEELEIFDSMDRQDHARQFVIRTGIAAHQKLFSEPGITYLSIENNDGELCGYFMLVPEEGSDTVEFRRIIIDQNQRGIGQAAINEMEHYCKKHFNAQRIWLDVFEDNQVGMHIYEKMGYKRFKEEKFEGRQLFFYEKALG